MYSDIDKFHYLKSSVNIQPESQNILNNYQFSGDNYKSAWEALCRRFDDRRVLLMQYTNSLMTISGPIDGSLSEARRVLDTYISHRAAFNFMKVTPEELLDMIFEQFVRNRFDKNLMREWDIHIDSSDEKPSWTAFCKFMDQRIKSLAFTYREGNSFGLFKSLSDESITSQSSKTSLVVNKNLQIEKCKLCSSSHRVYQCMNCLRPGHSKQECNSNSRCKVCEENHHTSLHSNNSNSLLNSQEATQT